MKNTQNGRGAIQLIRAQCEGAAADETRKKNAYNILSNSVFEEKNASLGIATLRTYSLLFRN